MNTKFCPGALASTPGMSLEALLLFDLTCLLCGNRPSLLTTSLCWKALGNYHDLIVIIAIICLSSLLFLLLLIDILLLLHPGSWCGV